MRFFTPLIALAFAAFSAQPLQAQQAPPPNYAPPSPIDIYAAISGHLQAFDGWNALPPGEQYDLGYQAGLEAGLRFFNEPYYVTVAGEFYFFGETEKTGTQAGLGTFVNHEEYMMYGANLRVGNGSINYNFGLCIGGGYIHLEETIEVPAGVALIGDATVQEWYFRAGIFFERVLFGDDYGFKVWIGVDLDYTWTGIRDALGGKNMAWYGAGIRIFFTF